MVFIFQYYTIVVEEDDSEIPYFPSHGKDTLHLTAYVVYSYCAIISRRIIY